MISFRATTVVRSEVGKPHKSEVITIANFTTVTRTYLELDINERINLKAYLKYVCRIFWRCNPY